MRTHLASATRLLLCFLLGFSAACSMPAQDSTKPPSATLVLKNIQIEKSLLDTVETGFSSKDGPGCDSLVALYKATLDAQTGIDVNNAATLRRLSRGPATAKAPSPMCDTTADFDYLIVNFVDWNQPSTVQPVSKWYLLSPKNTHSPAGFAAAATSGTRIYGSRKIGILLLQRGLGKPADADVRYTLSLQHKSSVQVSDFTSLLSVLNTAAAASATRPPETEAVVAIATTVENLPRLPDDLIFAGQTFLDRTAAAAQNGKPDAAFNQTYDDEGYANWDISAAIPVTGLKDIQYTQMGSTISAKTITRANAYALAHWYPYPVDLKGDYPWYPSVVAGLPLSGKPLDKPFAGLALGTRKPFPFQVNFFVGAVFNKVFTPASTTDATQLNSHRVTKLLYGIDLPIGKLVTALKGQ